MKTLDVFELKNGIDQTLNKLKQQSHNVKSLEKQINQIISLDGALKGEAGQAIKIFYSECHIPFLQFFQIIIDEYSGELKRQNRHSMLLSQTRMVLSLNHSLNTSLAKG